MANTIFRVGGGYTVFLYQGKPLAYVDVVRETGPRPAALEAGTIEVTFREQWNTEVWEQLPGFAGTNDLLGVFKAQLAAGPVTLTKIIGSQNTPIRRIDYLNCYVVNVMIDETVNIGTMTFPKSVQIMYTQRTEDRLPQS